MENTTSIDERQINLKNFRETLGIPDVHTAVFTFKNDEERQKSFEQSLKDVQEAMTGAAEFMGLKTEDDVVALIKETRAEIYDSLY